MSIETAPVPAVDQVRTWADQARQETAGHRAETAAWLAVAGAEATAWVEATSSEVAVEVAEWLAEIRREEL